MKILCFINPNLRGVIQSGGTEEVTEARTILISKHFPVTAAAGLFITCTERRKMPHVLYRGETQTYCGTNLPDDDDHGLFRRLRWGKVGNRFHDYVVEVLDSDSA